MKKVLDATIGTEPNKTTYRELIKIAINNVPKEGFGIEDIRKRLRVLDALEKKGDKIEFEDSDYELVKSCVNEQKWVVIDAGIVKFVDTINA